MKMTNIMAIDITAPRIFKKIKKEPQISILEKIKQDPKYTQARSIQWFKDKIKELGGNSPVARTELMQTTKEHQHTRFLPGAMYIFKYDPKYKEELPFYDGWPCSIMFAIDGEKVTGINFHYLPYEIRGKLFDKLWLIASKYQNNSQQQVLRMNWKLLSNVSKYPEIRPAIHSYLYSHIQSRLIKVPIESWKEAMLLPIDAFYKKSQAYVARNSSMQIRKLVGK